MFENAVKIKEAKTDNFFITLYKEGNKKLCGVFPINPEDGETDSETIASKLKCRPSSVITREIENSIKLLDIHEIQNSNNQYAVFINHKSIFYSKECVILEYDYKNDEKLEWDYEIPLSIDKRDFSSMNIKIVKEKFMRSMGVSKDFRYTKIKFNKSYTFHDMIQFLNKYSSVTIDGDISSVKIIRTPVKITLTGKFAEIIWSTKNIAVYSVDDTDDGFKINTIYECVIDKFKFVQHSNHVDIDATIKIHSKIIPENEIWHIEMSNVLNEMPVDEFWENSFTSALLAVYADVFAFHNKIEPYYGIDTMVQLFELSESDNILTTYKTDNHDKTIDIGIKSNLLIIINRFSEAKLRKALKVLNTCRIDISEILFVKVNKAVMSISNFVEKSENKRSDNRMLIESNNDSGQYLIPAKSLERLPLSILLLPFLAMGFIVMSILNISNIEKSKAMLETESGKYILRLTGAITITIILFLMEILQILL